MLARVLIASSATVILTLGIVHLVYTFRGPKLTPRDPAVQVAMENTHPVITRETTLWKAWIGFNASHSFGAILFGLVFGYLALVHPAFLFQSRFLLGVGFCLLAGYVFLGRLYWFSVPFAGILIASAFYLAGLVAALAGPSAAP